MNIQWFPGHMTKTRKQITDDMKQVDIIFELVDARIPVSSRNPEIDKILGDKPRIIIMTKCDLADEKMNLEWKNHFESNGTPCVLVSCTTGEGINEIYKQAEQKLKDKIAKRKEKGISDTTIKAMIVGIPNVGKSTLINKISGKSGAKTGNRPGVTKSKQWIAVKNKFNLLDTPGILWPKFEDERVGIRLAFTGAIKDEIIDVEELAFYLVEFLKENYRQALSDRYNVLDFDKDSYDLMEDIGKNRGCIMSGGSINMERVSNLLLDEYRAGKLGRITIDKVGD